MNALARAQAAYDSRLPPDDGDSVLETSEAQEWVIEATQGLIDGHPIVAPSPYGRGATLASREHLARDVDEHLQATPDFERNVAQILIEIVSCGDTESRLYKLAHGALGYSDDCVVTRLAREMAERNADAYFDAKCEQDRAETECGF
ncbi:hypothetical protein [Pseudomonas umsongensis]|uniref:Uncharacterized protein n=1 Tax=Pseudomonas umsongensis TaxID=198618 RepID=A0AAE6ZT67_9PSED|nr:hypothetical protein [Pseudomonas umsongensis]QJC78932.1 hypothetical protein HGP31_11625 [Pseudomonas umsongensis]